MFFETKGNYSWSKKYENIFATYISSKTKMLTAVCSAVFLIHSLNSTFIGGSSNVWDTFSHNQSGFHSSKPIFQCIKSKLISLAKMMFLFLPTYTFYKTLLCNDTISSNWSSFSQLKISYKFYSLYTGFSYPASTSCEGS